MNTKLSFLLIALLLACCALWPVPNAFSVVPAPDGGYAGNNTAEGTSALFSLTSGIENTGLGFRALYHNTTGNYNTAEGFGALFSNTSGTQNTATGVNALINNTTGNYNTANGVNTLFHNTTGVNNTANGYQALFNNTTGGYNTAVGYQAGTQITGSGNVCIGQYAAGVAGVNSTTWIRNVYPSAASGRAVYVNFDDKIGTLSSSRRYKDEIRPMAKVSQAILSLRPVSFRYKKQVDPTRCLSFGLIAEEVAQVNPDLVTPDRDGKPETVRYEAVNAMLLNEFLKAHRKAQQQEATITQLKFDAAKQEATISQLKKGMGVLTAQLREQAAQIQKVGTQVEMIKSAPQAVVNNP